MNTRRRYSDARNRMHERWTREDAAPRLSEEISGISKLTIEVEERQNSLSAESSSYVRHVIVDQAPALFEVPCSDSKCEGGGHDLTADIMRALRARKTDFEGEHECYGRLGTANCSRVLHFKAHAEYDGD